MARRRPQINFQVDEAMKLLYEQARLSGHWVTRLCAAGFLLMIENPRARVRAINRLIEWETEYENASPEEIRAFVQGARGAVRRGAQGTRPDRPVRRSTKRAGHSGSE